MSSRILSRGAAVSIAPMVWGTSDASPRIRTEFEQLSPADASDEIVELQSRLNALKQRLETDTAAAYQKGFHEGQVQERAQSGAEMQAAIQRLNKTVAEAAELRPRLRREAESDVVQLSLAIARRVLRREMSIDQSAMQALVKVALEKLERQEICRVYVHPNQAPAVKAAVEAQGMRSVEVVAEVSRDAGSLIFETNRGKLDASVNAQLEEIERGLTDRVNQQ
jgi:flagellar assembly protein FliH